MDPRTVMESLIDAVQRRDADSYAELYAEDVVAHHPLSPEAIRGREQVRASEGALFEAFSEIAVEARVMVAEGAACAAEVTLRAVNTGPLDFGDGESLPATGRTIELAATWWIEVDEDGLIISERDYFDTAALMVQLGLLAQ